MARAKHKKHITGDELDLTTFMNLMVILISSLLLNAVFTHLNSMRVERTGNKATESVADSKVPPLQLDVFVYRDRIVVDNRDKGTIATHMFTEGKPDYVALNNTMRDLKKQYPQETHALLRIAENVDYDQVIKVMDATRVVVSQQTQAHYPLFPNLQIASLEGTS